MKRFVSIVVSVALCLIVGFVSQRIQMEPLHSWYPLLNKSSLTPLKKSHEFGTIEIPKSACFAQLKQKENL